ncbi:MAG: ribulose phosphate epimerase [Myxococcales bacterium]|nr:ribulose phosphate epimerase [Myxococcales bacterium]
MLLAVSGCIGGDKQTSASGASGSTSGAVTSSTATTDAATSTSTSGTGTTSAASGTTSTSGAEACDPVETFGEATSGGLPECDVWKQDCPPCEKCTPYASDGIVWDEYGCVPVVPDPKQFGEPCTVHGSPASGFDDCDKGLFCWNVNEDNVGWCIAHCVGSLSRPECDDSAICGVYGNGVPAFCLPLCDPLLPECPGDDTCLPIDDWFVCVDDASEPDAGADGDPCWSANACDPGLLCMNGESIPGCQTTGCCASFCDLEEPTTCPLKDQGAECVPYYAMGEAPPGKENVGFCGLP